MTTELLIDTITPDDLFQKHLITDHLIKNRTLKDVYDILYSSHSTIDAIEQQEIKDNFLSQLYLLRKDTNIHFEEINYDRTRLSCFPHVVEYKYSYTHPVEKKVLFGPNSINVVDNYKLFFISKDIFVVEVTSTFTGFLLMDTFFTRLQYTFTQHDSDSSERMKEKDILLTVKFMIQFIKPNPFQALAISSGIEDNNKYINELLIPQMDHFLEVEQTSDMKTVYSDIDSNEEEEASNNSLYFDQFDQISYCLYEIFY